MAAVDAVWPWAQIDPESLSSVDFSRPAAAGSNWDLLNQFSDRCVDLEGVSLTAASTRLKRYPFEEQVHGHLADLHRDAFGWPDVRNKPGCDFEIDDARFDAEVMHTLLNVTEQAHLARTRTRKRCRQARRANLDGEAHPTSLGGES